MAFVMRTTKPGRGNKYYITKANGGYSDAIKGSPTDSECDVLANCVGYAYGRFNEIGGYGYCKYLRPVNAENFMQYKGSLKTGMTPQVGACMVWQKGASLSGSDGAGHVAIVEKVISDTEVMTSESGWGCSNPFWTKTRKKGNGDWGAGSAYKFLGFIYNPAVKDEVTPQPVKPAAKGGNSSLVLYSKISPNRSSPRNHKIDTITIHHMAGNLSIEACCNMFASNSRQASSNYCVGTDGRIGMSVEEKDRSWCSSSRENDNRAITIEVANDTFAPNWHVSDKALESTINLCVDICRRNGITRLNFTGDKSGNLTMHKWFAATLCPGPYLESKFPYIAEEVNKRLGSVEPEKPVEPSNPTNLEVGDVIKLKQGAVYTNGRAIPQWVVDSTTYVRQIYSNGNIVFSIQKTGDVTGVVAPDQIEGNTPSVPSQPESSSYLVKVTADVLNIRKGPGTNYPTTGAIRDHGIYTIVETQDNWGKLKSGAGWICLDYTVKKKT